MDRHRERLAWRMAVVACGLAVVGLAVCCVPAFALSQRGHEFKPSISFGSSGEGALSKPGAVAVSDVGSSRGDVYVLDRGHDRIVQYGARGEFISAWGWGVKDGEAKYETCTAGCRSRGIGGRGEDQFNERVMGIAVDNCTATKADGEPELETGGEPKPCPGDPSVGDVYVLMEYANEREEKKLKKEEEEAEPREQIVSEYASIDKLSGSGTPIETVAKQIPYEGGETSSKGKPVASAEELTPEIAHGVAVGLDGIVWVYDEEELYPLSDATLSEPAATHKPHEPGEWEKPLPLELAGEPASGLAAGPQGDFYVGQVIESATLISKQQIVYNEAGEREESAVEAVVGLDAEDSSAVAANQLDVPSNAVDERDDAYVTNVAGVAGEHTSSLAELAGGGTFVQRLTAPGLREGAGVAVEADSGTVYVSDAASNDVNVFVLEEPGPPRIDSASAQDVGSASAQVNGQIDPAGAATTYAFRYAAGSVPGAGQPCTAPCEETPDPRGSLGAAFGDRTVTAHLALAPDTTYHYRLVAFNEHGGATGPEGTFTTRPVTSAAGEADGRMWEMVSPPDEQGGVELGSTFATLPGGRVAEAAEDGQAVTYANDGPVGAEEGSRSFEPTQLLSMRGPTGWAETEDIVTPSQHAEGIRFGYGSEYHVFSSDLALALVQPFNEASRTRLAEPPLSPPTSEAERGGQEKTLYIRADRPVEPQRELQSELYAEAAANGAKMSNPGYVALVTEADADRPFGSDEPGSKPPLEFVGATPDLGHVVIESHVAGEKGCQPDRLGCTTGLYEWGTAGLNLISVLPDGDAAQGEPKLGTYKDGGEIVRHAIADDGSRVFWSANNHLYLTDTVGEQEHTIQLDQEQPGAPGEGEVGSVFQTASTDGSLSFFTDEQSLTEGAGAISQSPDLYAYDADSDTLTDLSPCRTEEDTETHKRRCVERADVQGLVLGASESGCDAGQAGCYVYFSANGVLSDAPNAQGEKAEPGACGPALFAGAACNLYVEQYEGGEWKPPTFIARLSDEDQPDWQSKFGGGGGQTTVITSARVSPNGRYLAFMSDQPLTGYDNHDAVTGEADEEVFLYEVGAKGGSPGRLVCASCKPNGARPTGVLDLPLQPSEAGAGLLVDRNGVWAEHRLAASLPDWTLDTEHRSDYQPRYLSNRGRLYFNSPSDLVPQATNGEMDVYEYEPVGVPQGAHQCTSVSATYSQGSEGCLGLVSAGTATGEATFLDASESGGEGPGGEELAEGGGDVFFVTAAQLVPQDTDEALNVYDAHECTAAEPCVAPEQVKPATVCEGEQCRSPASSPPALRTVASGSPSGQGNVPANQGVSSSKTVKPKPPTRAQELAKALAACRSKHRHSRKRRTACEHSAKKRYGPVKKKAKKGDKKASHGRERGGAR